jgi:hypothetical protein
MATRSANAQSRRRFEYLFSVKLKGPNDLKELKCSLDNFFRDLKDAIPCFKGYTEGVDKWDWIFAKELFVRVVEKANGSQHDFDVAARALALTWPTLSKLSVDYYLNNVQPNAENVRSNHRRITNPDLREELNLKITELLEPFVRRSARQLSIFLRLREELSGYVLDREVFDFDKLSVDLDIPKKYLLEFLACYEVTQAYVAESAY